MGRLFFYSDQIVKSPGNERLDNVLFDGMKMRDVKIGYIPSTEDIEKKFYREKVQYYQQYGVRDVMFFDLYDGFNSSKIEELRNCDIIHLSAGNPIEFRRSMKRCKVDETLRHYFQQGGTIVGVSGGAVQLGRSTGLFQLFTGDAHEEELAALNLVDFEFLPHYNRWDEEFKSAVREYVSTTGTTVYAGNDGDGMIVNDGNIQMMGNIITIKK